MRDGPNREEVAAIIRRDVGQRWRLSGAIGRADVHSGYLVNAVNPTNYRSEGFVIIRDAGGGWAVWTA